MRYGSASNFKTRLTTTMNEHADSADLASRLDHAPVTLLHLLATALCAAGFLFDLLEIALSGVLSAVFSSPSRGIPAAQLSLLLSSIYFGAIIGAPAMGWWADKHGRKMALAAMLMWLAVMSFAGAFAADIQSLTWIRAAAGFALGAFPPLVMAYLTDILPPKWRGMLIFTTIGTASLGPVIGVF